MSVNGSRIAWPSKKPFKGSCEGESPNFSQSCEVVVDDIKTKDGKFDFLIYKNYKYKPSKLENFYYKFFTIPIEKYTFLMLRIIRIKKERSNIGIVLPIVKRNTVSPLLTF